MNDWARLVATTIVWGAMAAIIFSVARLTVDVAVITFVLMIGATISTISIWMSGRTGLQQLVEPAEKAKRNRRVTRLVDNLDEDDIYQLEELLTARRESQYQGRD